MPRVNRAKADAEGVLEQFPEPKTALERMAVVGAKVVLKRLRALEDYRERNREQLLEYSKTKAKERRDQKRKEMEAAGIQPRKRGRPRKTTEVAHGDEPQADR